MSVPEITTPDTRHSLETSPLPEQSIRPEQLTSASSKTNAIDALNTPMGDVRYEPSSTKPRRTSWYRIAGIILVIAGLVVAGILALRHANQAQQVGNTDTSLNLKPQTTSLSSLDKELTDSAAAATLTINGQLAVNNSLRLMPSTQPTGATAGQLYYDQTVNQLGYYNGNAFIYLQGGGVANINTTNISGGTTNITNIAGGGLGGGGTPGTIALFTSSTALGDSIVSQSGKNLTVAGTAKFINNTNTTTALQVQNTSGASVLSVDTANGVVVLGNDGSTPTATTLRGGAGVGTNISGANLVIAGSNGTGSANGGDIIFQTGQSPQGGIQLDAAAQASGNGATVTTNFTVSNEKDRILMVLTDWAATSVTYNGQPLTSIASVASAQHFGNGTYMEMWYLLNPPSGTFALTATAGGGGTAMGVAAYYNVNQTTPLGAPVTSTNSTSGSGSTTVSVLTANTSQVVIDAMSVDRDSSSQTCTPNTGQTTRWSIVQQFFHVGCGGDIAANGGLVTLGWNVTDADWVDIGVTLNPAVPGSTPLQQIGGSTPDTLFDRLHITATGNVGINNSNPQYALDINGTSNASVATYSPIFDTANSGTLKIGNLNATSIQIGNASSNIATSILGTVIVRPTPGNNSVTNFQIQDAGSAPLLIADTTNATIIIAGNTNFATLSMRNTHLESTQTTPPTVAVPSSCGTNPTASVTPASTDTAGSLSLTTGTGSPTACATTVTFNQAYATAPKSVIIMPTVAVGGATDAIVGRVSAVNTTSFTIQTAPVNPAVSTTYSFYYLVVE